MRGGIRIGPGSYFQLGNAGSFRYGNNHFPIESFYLQDVVKDGDGQLSLKTVSTIVKDDQDRFHDKCPMK